MNLPTLLGAALVLAVFSAIVGKGIYNKLHHKGGGCGCGCAGCANAGACHPQD